MADKLTVLRAAITDVQQDLHARTPFNFMVGLIAMSSMASMKQLYAHDNAPAQADIAAYALAKRFETEFKKLKEAVLKAALSHDDRAAEHVEASVASAKATGTGVDTFTLMEMPDMSLTFQVRKPSERVDIKKVIAELRKAGVVSSVIDAAIEAGTSKSSPAKVFDVVQS